MSTSIQHADTPNREYCYVLGDACHSDVDLSKMGVQVISSRAEALLVTTLCQNSITETAFRCGSKRLMRLLVEEALALVPMRRVEIVLSSGHQGSGIAMVRPPCAVSMEREATPMLELFHKMEPDLPTGCICFHQYQSPSPLGYELTLFDAKLPASLENHDVFLLDHVISSSERLCTALHCLERRGAANSQILIVSLIESKSTMEQLHARFPAVKFVTTQIMSDGVEEVERDESQASQIALVQSQFRQCYQSVDGDENT